MSEIVNMTKIMEEVSRLRGLLWQRTEQVKTLERVSQQYVDDLAAMTAERDEATRALQTMREVNDYDAKYQVELEAQLAAQARCAQVEEALSNETIDSIGRYLNSLCENNCGTTARRLLMQALTKAGA